MGKDNKGFLAFINGCYAHQKFPLDREAVLMFQYTLNEEKATIYEGSHMRRLTRVVLHIRIGKQVQNEQDFSFDNYV